MRRQAESGAADLRPDPPEAGTAPGEPGATARGDFAPGRDLPVAAHSEPADAVVAALGSDAERGLHALACEVPGVKDVVFKTQPTPRAWIGAP